MVYWLMVWLVLIDFFILSIAIDIMKYFPKKRFRIVILLVFLIGIVKDGLYYISFYLDMASLYSTYHFQSASFYQLVVSK